MTDRQTCIDADFLRGFPGIELVPHAVRLLASGRPVAPEEIASAARVPVERVQQLLRDQPGSEWDEDGRLLGFGLTQRATAHNLILPTASLYTWCAMDTLLFALMLRTPATAVSSCPATGRSIRVEISPDAIDSVDPDEAVVSQVFAVAIRDIRHEVCDHGHFFASAEAADGWVRDHPDGAVLSIRDAFVQSQRAYEQMGWGAER
jgi:alkylmercury lyase